MNHIQNFFLNLSIIPKTFSTIQNSSKLLLDYLGLVKENYVVQLRDGIQVQVRHSCTDKGVVKEVFVLEQYAFVLPHVKPGAVVFDIGAQIGSFSLYVGCRHRDCQIYSFEPMKDNFAMLERNVALNKAGNIRPNNLAVLAKTERIKLFLSSENTGMHSVYGQGENFQWVDGVGINDLFARFNQTGCDIMKLDCEGAEYDIILGATPETLRSIGCIVMEWHDKAKVPDMVRKLESCGFVTEAHPRYDVLFARNKGKG